MDKDQIKDEDFEGAFAEEGTQDIKEPDQPEPEDNDDAGQGDDIADNEGDGSNQAEEDDDQDDGDDSPDAQNKHNTDNADNEEDPWKDAPEALRTAHQQAQAENERLRNIDKSHRGHVSSLQRQVNDLTAQLKELSEKGNKGGDKADDGEEVDADLEELRTEYPEIYGPVSKMLKSRDHEIDGLKRELSSYSDDRRNTHLNEQVAIAQNAHSDLVQIANSQELADWIVNQPPYIQQAFQRNADVIIDGEEAAHIITLFKQETGRLQQQKPSPTQDAGGKSKLSDKRKRQIEAARSIQGKGGATPSGIAEDDFDGAFDNG